MKHYKVILISFFLCAATIFSDDVNYRKNINSSSPSIAPRKKDTDKKITINVQDIDWKKGNKTIYVQPRSEYTLCLGKGLKLKDQQKDLLYVDSEGKVYLNYGDDIPNVSLKRKDLENRFYVEAGDKNACYRVHTGNHISKTTTYTQKSIIIAEPDGYFHKGRTCYLNFIMEN